MVPVSIRGIELQPNEYDLGHLNLGRRLGTTMYMPGDYRSDLLGDESGVWHGGSQGFAADTVVRFYGDVYKSSLDAQSATRDQLPEFEVGPGRLGLDIGLGRSQSTIPLSEIVQARDIVERLSDMISDVAEFGLNTVTTSIGFVYRLQARPEQ